MTRPGEEHFQGLPVWMTGLLSEHIGLAMVDVTGKVDETFGQVPDWIQRGQAIFDDVPVFVGMEEVFEGVRIRSDGIEIDSFKPTGESQEKRYSAKVKWIGSIGQFCISIVDQPGSGGIGEAAIQKSRKEKYLEDCLAAERKRYEQIYKSTPALMAAFTSQGKTTAVSNRFRELLGVGTDSDAVEGAFSDLISSSLWSDAWKRRNLDDAPLAMDTPALGKRELELSSFHFGATADQVEQCYFVANDVTERNRFRDQLEAQSENLEKANQELESRNTELERFAAVASHDLKAPLRQISVYSDMLEYSLENGEFDQVPELLSILRNSAKKSRQLVDDMLELAQLGQDGVQFRRVQVQDLINDLLEDLSLQIEAADAEVKVDVNVQEIEIDPELFRQIISNLLSNAVKFSSVAPNSQVSVTVSMDDCQNLCVVVEDNGIGFHNHQAARMFEPFVRLPGSGDIPGCGVGLTIVKRAIDLLGGEISATSEFAKGSKFSVSLPHVDRGN